MRIKMMRGGFEPPTFESASLSFYKLSYRPFNFEIQNHDSFQHRQNDEIWENDDKSVNI